MSDLTGLTQSVTQVRAREVEIGNFSGGVRRFAVEIPVYGAGEITRQIWFPSAYVEKPLHNWGLELVSNNTVPDGVAIMPTAGVMIRSWDAERMQESGVTLYRGCRAVLSTRSSLQQATFSFTLFFEGRAITRPGKT